jgi:hypothetical protein
MKHAAAAAIALLLTASAARAADRPPLTPQRDVDVVYLMVQVDSRGTPHLLRQRMRWAAAAAKLRVDPPIPDLYMVMDLRAHRMSAVRPGRKAVVETASPDSALPGMGGSSFARGAQDSVAGLACTDWLTQDVNGTPTRACITADGVLLRAVAAGRVLLEAERVDYAAQDQSVFRIPDDYTRLTPPSPAGAPKP